MKMFCLFFLSGDKTYMTVTISVILLILTLLRMHSFLISLPNQERGYRYGHWGHVPNICYGTLGVLATLKSLFFHQNFITLLPAVW